MGYSGGVGLEPRGGRTGQERVGGEFKRRGVDEEGSEQGWMRLGGASGR